MSDPVNPSTPPPVESADATSPTAGDEDFAFPLRALITSRDAGVIIGKGGKNVADLREAAGVKAGVSKAVIGGNGVGVPPVGAQERVLSVSGPLEGVAKAYFLVAQAIAENPLSPQLDGGLSASSSNRAIRFLVSHNLMGSIIGKEGKKIKEIQDRSGARVVAHKDMLPNSTERVVEVSGSPESIQQAVLQIGRCLIDDWDRGQGTVLYQPGAAVILGPDGIPVQGNAIGLGFPGGQGGYGRRSSSGYGGGLGYGRRTSTGGEYRNGDAPGSRRPSTNVGGGGVGAASAAVAAAGASTSAAVPTPSDASLRTQNISIPSDMVGCIIGKAGVKINEIRRLSGSRISIAKVPHDETGERMFTITGTSDANEKALYLLYSSLESEKERRVSVHQEEDDV